MEYKTIYDYFKDYNEEEVNRAIKYLTDKSKRILNLKYGDDLKNPILNNQLTEKENIYFETKVIYYIKNNLKKIYGKPNLKKKKTIYDFFKGYTEEEVDRAINLLKKRAKEILILKYGNDFKNSVIKKLNATEEKYFHNSVIASIRRNLLKGRSNQNNKKNKTIYEYFKDYTEEEVDYIIKTLSYKAKKILVKKFGNDFKNPITNANLEEHEKEYFLCTILRTMRKRLNDQRNGKKVYVSYQSIYDYFKDYTKEEVNNVIQTLPEKYKEILFLKYGEDLEKPNEQELNSSDRTIFRTRILSMIKDRLLKSKKVKKPVPIKRIYDYFKDYTEEEIDLVIDSLSKKSQDILKLKYNGDDLKNPKSVTILEKPDRKFFTCDVLPIMRQRLAKNRINQHKIPRIYDYYQGYTEDEVDYVIATLSLKSKDILNLKYGDDLKNPKKINRLTKQDSAYFFSYIKRHIKSQLIKIFGNREIENDDNLLQNDILENSSIPKEDYLKLIKVLKQFILNNLLEILTYQETIVVIFKLILNYDTKTVANLVKISEKEVLEITKKFLQLYKDLTIRDIKAIIQIKKVL